MNYKELNLLIISPACFFIKFQSIGLILPLFNIARK